MTKVSYPTDSGWKTMVTPKEMETKILDQNITHFGQASDTPAAMEGSIYQIPLDTPPNQFHTLLPPDTTQGLKAHFLRLSSTPNIDTRITPAQFISGIRKWKEKTSTSPSGRHLGHYHSIILPPMGDEEKNI